MILQALAKHYENLAEQGNVSRPGWCHAKVSYAVNLSETGEILSMGACIAGSAGNGEQIWS